MDGTDGIGFCRIRCAALSILEDWGILTGAEDTHCPVCKCQVNGDEFQFLFVCSELQDLRAK